MNKKILNATLMLIPKKIQRKAVAKALNFIFPHGLTELSDGRTLKLEVTDLKRSWIVDIDKTGCHPTVNNTNPNIIVRANLDVIVNAQDLSVLKNSLRQGEIEIFSNSEDKSAFDKSINIISQTQLDALVERCYIFLKIKPKPRFDIKTVTLADIKTARDVDWLRDEAVKLEASNMADALRLMEIAHQARPSGPFIKRKVEEYRSVLHGNN